ncbi:hypothetical protein [Thalassococcus sp. S3]|uniref:hypothetical protein n=1 Tax=Thalassococcus sp. S3 TaxID=2017482 RepID=UPI00102D180D|nr:hypothetical protein [Thalassococcus sp. S3]
MPTDPTDLIKAILANYSLEAGNIHHPAPTNWDEFAAVFIFKDDFDSITSTGFAYEGEEFVGFFIPDSTVVDKKVRAYRAAMTSESGEMAVSIAVQFNRDSGRYKTLFEFDDPKRWDDTPRRWEIRADLRPNLA